MAKDDDAKPGLITKFVRERTGPNDPEYGKYKSRNKGAEYFSPDMVDEYKPHGRHERRRPFEFKSPSNIATIPNDLLVQAMDIYNGSSIVRDMGAGATLMQMLDIYERNVATTENAFSRLYKDRPSTHEADIEERERVAREMHTERAQAREFLDYIKEGMQNRNLLSEYEINTFDKIIHPQQFRRGR